MNMSILTSQLTIFLAKIHVTFGRHDTDCHSDDGKIAHVYADKFRSMYTMIIVKKLNSLKHLVRTTVAESHN